MGNKFIKIALGAVVALACLPIIVTTIASMVGEGGALANNETLSTLLNLVPLAFVGGILGTLFISTSRGRD